MATSERQAHTLKELAKVIIEENNNGLYPVEYRLPTVVFSDEGELAKLSPAAQAIVEENIDKIKSGKNRKVSLSLKGLISFVAEGSENFEKGNEVVVGINPMDEIILTKFSHDLNVDSLSYKDLVRLNNILDTKCAPRDTQWKYAKYLTLKRIKKLRGEL